MRSWARIPLPLKGEKKKLNKKRPERPKRMFKLGVIYSKAPVFSPLSNNEIVVKYFLLKVRLLESFLFSYDPNYRENFIS